MVGHTMDGFNVVMDEEYLSPSRLFFVNGLLDNEVVEGADSGLNGPTILGWCVNDTEIPNPYEGHVQGARNGRGC